VEFSNLEHWENLPDDSQLFIDDKGAMNKEVANNKSSQKPKFVSKLYKESGHYIAFEVELYI
jgi:hypothetical protein